MNPNEWTLVCNCCRQSQVFQKGTDPTDGRGVCPKCGSVDYDYINEHGERIPK